MPNAGVYWETLLYGLAGTSSGPWSARRDRILAALREIGYDPAGAAALDDAALAARPPHRLVIVASDGSDDDLTLAAIPEDALDDDARAALELLDGTAIETSTPDDDPARWDAWVRVALATGARSRLWFDEIAAPVPEDADAHVDRWAAHAFTPGRHARLDGARLDQRFTQVTFVIERV